MAAASEPALSGPWTGRTGRAYHLDPRTGLRHGRATTVIPVLAQGPPVGRSTVEEGTLLALKHPRDPAEGPALKRELRMMVALARAHARPPAPRVLDGVETAEGQGAVIEWCPQDLELWWAAHALRPDGFKQLCLVLAGAARQLADLHASLAREADFEDMRPHVRPRSILLGSDGRWLFSGFSPTRPPEIAEEEGASATVLLLTSENYASPEVIFGARQRIPVAMGTWSLGASFLALLRMRSMLLSRASLPATGTESHHFRSHRLGLVSDLFERKPRLFLDRDLDARQFLYPDRIPDPDRRAVADALVGLLGEPQEALEAQLAREVLALFERALTIAPEQRYTDALQMAEDLDALALRFDALRAELVAAQIGAGDKGTVTEVMAAAARAALDEDEPQAPGPKVTPFKPEAKVRTPSSRPPPPRRGFGLLVVLFVAAFCFGLGGLGGWLAHSLYRSTADSLASAASARPPAAPLKEPPAVQAPPEPVAPPPVEVAEVEPVPPVAPVVAVPPPAGSAEDALAEAPAVVAQRPASTKTSSTSTSARPSSTATSSPPPPAGGTGLVKVEGADSAWLVGSSGRIAPGTVAAGSYVLKAKVGGKELDLGSVAVAEGADILFRCGFGTCRRVR